MLELRDGLAKKSRWVKNGDLQSISIQVSGNGMVISTMGQYSEDLHELGSHVRVHY